MMHLNGSSSQDFSVLLTFIALEGHFRSHMPQKMHLSISLSSRPLTSLKGSLFTIGYFLVAGLENKFLATLPIISNMSSPYLSVQLMHGSIVSINIGTSASSEPGSIFSSDGMFAKVGVLTRILSRFFVPFALK